MASSATSPGVAARTLACIADVLGAMAGERAGLRSGPARNESWMQAFELLDVCTPLCWLALLTRITGEKHKQNKTRHLTKHFTCMQTFRISSRLVKIRWILMWACVLVPSKFLRACLLLLFANRRFCHVILERKNLSRGQSSSHGKIKMAWQVRR